MTTFDTLAAIAAPIVRYFKTDLEHDRAALAKMQRDDIAFWAPRECGTQFIHCASDLEELRWNLGYLNASEQTFGPRLSWYKIADGRVQACTLEHARGCFESRIAAHSRKPRKLCGADIW